MGPSALTRWASTLLLLIGCSQQPDASPRDRIRAILSDPGQLEILALDPYRIDYDLVTLGLVEHLQGYEILHRAHIEDGELEAEIVRLVLLGIDAFLWRSRLAIDLLLNLRRYESHPMANQGIGRSQRQIGGDNPK